MNCNQRESSGEFVSSNDTAIKNAGHYRDRRPERGLGPYWDEAASLSGEGGL